LCFLWRGCCEGGGGRFWLYFGGGVWGGVHPQRHERDSQHLPPGDRHAPQGHASADGDECMEREDPCATCAVTHSVSSSASRPPRPQRARQPQAPRGRSASVQGHTSGEPGGGRVRFPSPSMAARSSQRRRRPAPAARRGPLGCASMIAADLGLRRIRPPGPAGARRPRSPRSRSSRTYLPSSSTARPCSSCIPQRVAASARLRGPTRRPLA